MRLFSHHDLLNEQPRDFRLKLRDVAVPFGLVNKLRYIGQRVLKSFQPLVLGAALIVLSLWLMVRRERLVLSHMVYIFGGSAAIMLISGFYVGLGAVIGTGDSGALTRLFFEMAGMIPALWAIGGIALLLFGALPRWMTGISYGLLTLFVLMEIF